MFIIDGHNLIPKIRGLTLEALDDEEKLLGLLQEFSRVKGKSVEVFFDGAPPGHAGMRTYGTIRAHFVSKKSEADEAIQVFLRGLGNRARNYTVVSSDHKVQAYARERRAAVMTSEAFAEMLAEATEAARAAAAQKAAQEAAKKALGGLQEYYDLFEIDPEQAEKPIVFAGKPKFVKKPAPVKRENPPRPEKPRKHHGFKKKE